MANQFRKPTNINTTEGNVFDRVHTDDPLLYMNTREQIIKNNNARNQSGSSNGSTDGQTDTKPEYVLNYSWNMDTLDVSSSDYYFGYNDFFHSKGYHTVPNTDNQSYDFSILGERICSYYTVSHMSFVNEIRKCRNYLRTSLTQYQSFNPYVSAPIQQFTFNKFNNDVRYWYEMMYHLCVSGSRSFVANTTNKTQQETLLLQNILDEWKTLSQNNLTIPVSNSAGSTSSVVEKINLKEAAENCVISGGYIPSLNKWIWRLTAPPPLSNFTLNDPSQTDLPQNISIPANSRGVWIVRNVAGKPNYVPYVSFETPSSTIEKMFAHLNMSTDIDQTGNQRPWDGQNIETIAYFKGNPYPTGTRAYPWEFNPTNPEISSPWHNILYTTTIGWYKWGCRSFSLYAPFGTELISWFLAPHVMKTTHTSTTDPEYSPARWKGFKYAIRSMLEGTMVPTNGDTPISEPCNIHIYMSTQRPVKIFRDKSTAYWNSLGSNNLEKDTNYYKELDKFLDDIIEMKGRTPNSGKLYLSTSSVVRSCTPKTMHLFRSVGGYQTDALELSDWYVRTKIRNSGIPFLYEARAEKTIDKSIVFGETQGTVGPVSDVEWAGEGLYIGEGWMWYSNPVHSDVSNYTTNEETPLIFRLFSNYFPIVDPQNRDPYQTALTYTYNGKSRTISYFDNSYYSNHYTPSAHLWDFFALSDAYRYMENKTGVKLNRPQIISFAPERFARGGTGGANPYYCTITAGVDPYNNYWKVSPEALDVRIQFVPVQFEANSQSYGSSAGQGWWTNSGISYWDMNIRQTTMQNLLPLLETHSNRYCPPNSPDCTGDEYGSVNDDITIGTMGGLYNP